MPLPSTGYSKTIQIKKNGEVLDADRSSPQSGPQVVFPDKELTIGDSWPATSVVTLPTLDDKGDQNGSVPVTLKQICTLEAFEEVDGYSTAVIKLSGPAVKVDAGEGNQHTMQVEGTTWFAIEEGVLVRSHLQTITALGSPKADVTTRVVVLLILLPDPLAPKRTGETPAA